MKSIQTVTNLLTPPLLKVQKDISDLATDPDIQHLDKYTKKACIKALEQMEEAMDEVVRLNYEIGKAYSKDGTIKD